MSACRWSGHQGPAPLLQEANVPKERADRYAGQFDGGWSAYRQRVLARQKDLGVMPADAELSRDDPDVPDWDSLPAEGRRRAARMMEVFAGFLTHTDHHIGRLLEFLGVTQAPIHGVSFAHTFDDAAAPTRHRTQHYEMFGHRAIDHDGWRAVCPWPGPSFAEAGKLYHVATDPAENGSANERILAERPQVAEPRTQYTYRPGTQTAAFFAAPRVLDRPHAITADADIPPGGAQGVLLCQGSSSGGWSFYVKDQKLCYAHNYLARATYQVCAPEPLPAGRHQLRFEFEPAGAPDIAHGKGSPGRAQLYLDGQLIAQDQIPVTTPIGFSPGGLTCGANPGSAITTDYTGPFRFAGTLHSVTVDLSGDLITDTDSEMRMAMARQ